MTINVEIDQKQLQEILKKADPATLKKDIQDLIKEASDTGHHAALHNIQGGTQQAGHSMRADVKAMEAKVYSVMPPARALSIEEGRKPGEDVPYMQIARWTTGRRYLTQRRLKDLSKDERNDINANWAAISVMGARGKKFIEGAGKAVQKELPRMLGKVAEKIESRWSK